MGTRSQGSRAAQKTKPLALLREGLRTTRACRRWDGEHAHRFRGYARP